MGLQLNSMVLKLQTDTIRFKSLLRCIVIRGSTNISGSAYIYLEKMKYIPQFYHCFDWTNSPYNCFFIVYGILIMDFTVMNRYLRNFITEVIYYFLEDNKWIVPIKNRSLRNLVTKVIHYFEVPITSIG